jgi:YYY domain-containing protein
MSRPRLWLLLLVLFALSVRIVGLNWDQGHHFHPDERAIVGAVERLSFDWKNPQLNPRWFNYGTLPLYVIRAATDALSFITPKVRAYDNLILVGRAVSAVAGTLTVVLLVLLGTRLYNVRVGLLAGFLLAAAPLHIQNSHFATTDVFLTFFVLLALYFFTGIVARGLWRDYAAAGAAIGLAMATKFSAAPLLAPLGVALLVRLYRERRLLKVAAGGLLALAAVGAAFFAGQPYAVLDFAAYYKDIQEQSQMVRVAGRLPYTNQYIGTAKYGYELYHVIVFGMAPALGIAALWAAVRQVARIRRGSGEHLVLLAWVIPFFAVSGWFEVKFVRYMLPIYPPLILWAAAWLTYRSAPSRLMQWLTWIVAGTTLLAAVAFLSIYTRPHTIVTASEWVYRHVPAGSTILTQHWDEGFPFSLPNFPGRRFKVIELPYYEEDKPAKIQLMSRHLAQADYLALQTKRLYGAVTRAPEKFPRTNNYFYLLFAGDLGYTLVYDHASRPGLFGFELPDEILDESISVYDHPKVLIFQNTGRLTQEEIADRIYHGFPSAQLSRNDLLLARAGDSGGGAGGNTAPVRSSWLALLYFAAVVELLGLSAYFLLYPRLQVSGSYALAKVLGVLLFAYVSWLLTSLGQIEFTRTALALIIVALAILGVAARSRWQARPARREWWPTELLFWGSFAFFLAVRAFNPEVYWGEKPMDFAFLNALTRSTQLPPPEPWFAGSHLHYSYFGHYVIAALGKSCNIHPGITFNLGIALTAGLTTIAAFALGCALSDRWRVGLLAAFFATLLGNLAGPRELVARKVVNFDYFWATSRVIKDTINEYPFWSFLFADLHAHVLVMPFSVAFVTLAVLWVRRDAQGAIVRPLVVLGGLGLTLGAVMVTNTWSAFTYVPFLPFLLATTFLARRHGGVLRWLWHAITHVLLPAAAVFLLAVALYLPYWRNWTPPDSNWGWERDAFAHLWDFANIFGLFLFIAVPFVFAVWRGVLTRFGAARLTLGQTISMAAVGLTIAVCLALSQPAVHGALNLGGVASVRVALALLGIVALHLALERSTPEHYRLVATLFSFAFFVTAGVDVIHVWDRMNTVFKFYLEAWFIFSAAAAVAAYELWRGGLRAALVRGAWQVGLVALIGVALFTAGSATYGVLTTNRVRTPKPTLDGTAYLPLREAHEAAAFEWLNQNIAGIPVIAEAYGPSYQEYARVSMNTGLPTVLGWDYHVYQRAHGWGDINRRKADLEKLYTGDNKEAVKAILGKYHVSLVYLGPLERRRYPGTNLDRFRQWDDVLTPVYQNAGVSIFGVKGRFTGQRVATIEEVPAESGEAAPPPGEAGQLRQPRGVAVNSKGIVFVADFDNHRVQAFDKDLEFVLKWGERGDLPGQFKQPCGIAVDAGDTVYVADTWNQRVQVFSSEGKYLREFGGPFYGPRGIGVTAAGEVYLADTGNHRVRRFDATGKEAGSWGGIGEQPGQLKEPIGVTVDGGGRVYVCDNGNARLQIFDANGRLETSFAVDGWESKVFSEPYVAVTPDGTIWVTVPLLKVVRGYDRAGNILHEIGAEAGDRVLYKHPIGVAYDATTHELVITDLENNLARFPVPE